MSRLDDAARSTLYFLLSFPLGTAYFAFVVGGVAAGVSLLVFVVGAVVLAAVAAVSRRLAAFDAALGARLFDVPAPAPSTPRSSDGLLDATIAELSSVSGYRAVLYLLFRFAVGLVGFTYVVTWVGLAVGFLSAPLYYDDPEFTVSLGGVLAVDTLPVALAVAAIGVVVAVLGGLVVASAGRVAALGATYVLELPRPDAT